MRLLGLRNEAFVVFRVFRVEGCFFFFLGGGG